MSEDWRDWNDYDDPDFDESVGQQFKHHREEVYGSDNHKYITRKAFVITLIICMIVTSAVTFGAVRYFGVRTISSDGGKISATNYNLAKSTGSQKTVEEIVEENKKAVVEIKTESVATDSWLNNYVKEGAGSGVIVDSDGYILTCNHVISGASNIVVTLSDGTEYKAKVVGTDAKTDVAVLKISGKNFPAAKYGNSDDLAPGNLVVAIGNPLGQLGGSASAGIVSARDRELVIQGQKMNLIQTDTSINPGNSGGGLFNGEGKLVGIVVAKSTGSDVEGIGFAIPINKAAEIAKSLIKEGKVSGRSSIGVTVLEIPDAQTAMKYNVKNTGVYITEVTGKNAKNAGLQKGDMIYYLGDKRIEKMEDLTEALDKLKPGTKVEITVVRDNKTVKMETVLDEA